MPDESYWRPGPFWLAYDWDGAQRLQRLAGGAAAAAAAVAPPAGHVILIDEIDKADSDLPNSLLEALGQRGFRIPALGHRWVGGAGSQQPLVIVTTNEERELPAAFLRRCIVLNLMPPANGYHQWLMERGAAHHGPDADKPIAESVRRAAADQMLADRGRVEAAGLQPPGPAEYLDLLAALHDLAPGDAAEQASLLRRLSAYAFLKHGHVDGHPELSQMPSEATAAGQPPAG